jgi:hypothetical protein
MVAEENGEDGHGVLRNTFIGTALDFRGGRGIDA